MKTTATAFGVLAIAGIAAAGLSADLRITETYVGVTGEDGTPDWIEITNFGAAQTISGLYFDDTGPNLGQAGLIPDFTIGAGESIIVLTETADADLAAEAANFEAIWNSGAQIVNAAGGGGLSQDGDEAYIGLDVGGSFQIIDGLVFGSVATANTSTWEDIDGLGGAIQLSNLGVNGAYESNPFFNDNIGGLDEQITLIGSPGVIPTPGAAALLGVAGLAAIRRRR